MSTNDSMSAINPSLREELCESNRAIEFYLRGHFGMTLKLFKTVKALSQLVAVAAAIYAMYLGAPPFLTFLGAVLLVAGPEGLEYYLAQAGGAEQVSQLESALQESDVEPEQLVDRLQDEKDP